MEEKRAGNSDVLKQAGSLIEKGQWGYLTKEKILALLEDDPLHKKMFELFDENYGFSKARSWYFFDFLKALPRKDKTSEFTPAQIAEVKTEAENAIN